MGRWCFTIYVLLLSLCTTGVINFLTLFFPKPFLMLPLLTRTYCSVSVDTAAFAYGVAVGWPSAAVPILQSTDSPLGYSVSTESVSWISSVLGLVAVPATPAFSFLQGRYGSKVSGWLVAVPMAVAWLITAFAKSEAELYLSRVLMGVTAAGAFALCSIYVRDISEDSVRGATTSLIMTFATAGTVASYLAGWLFTYRTAALTALAGPVVFLAGFATLPETPWFLVSRGRLADARESLVWLRNTKDVEDELECLATKLKEKKEEQRRKPVGLRDLFATRANRKAFTIGMVLCANQQLSGVYAVLTYTQTIFSEAGGSLDPSVASVIVGVVLCLSNSASSFLVDRAGRRTLLLLSDVTMALSTAVLGAYFYAKSVQGAEALSHLGWLPLTCLSLFVVGISLGLYPVPYVMLAELFAPRIRTMASSAGIALTWLVSFLITKLFPGMVATMGEHGCYWCFSAVCILGTIYIAVAVPETKGRSLEDIQRQLQGERRHQPL